MKHGLLSMQGALAPFVCYYHSCQADDLIYCNIASELAILQSMPVEFIVGLYFSILIATLLAIFLLISRRRNSKLRQKVVLQEQYATDRLRFIRSLLDLCYAYRESPHVFLDKFKDRINFCQLKTYNLIDLSDKRLSPLKEDERMLCLLFELGFTQRELCAIFNLKKTSNLYVKYHRIKKKLNEL